MKKEKMLELLVLLEQDARQSHDKLAMMLDVPVQEVSLTIEKLEKENVILRYPALINWDKIQGDDKVTAMIDVKVTPQRDKGFDEIAERIYRFPEVKSVYLMSGAYDLSVTIEGKTMKEVAFFVAQKLSTLDNVISTATHFILKTYKHDGVVYDQQDGDRRMVVSP
ncbi:Lrp/AsnC family transcriptional regulator [Ammoniphilus sp. CFH 90114]|uniref:Lrp/AsnC family transcriptional regulator n=1 Tax=Ammoniphilus sp. CFH 90114 TaxID=2493665 RepID=UPI00100FF2CF|nr:Lrp/AsnC family transcriptional regulator [Ammoniphilus sp. CFH 90114]RXT04515.1 Lrp/AsnC family transcriptional regulator [Ammoniphilus sp. CFH 90114]